MTALPTRDRILLTALESFSTAGYDGTSMRQLANKVGIQAASLYAHFDSKQSILKTLIETRGPGSGVSLLREAATPGKNPDTVIRDFTELLIQNWTSSEARLFRSMLSRMGAEMLQGTHYLTDVKAVISGLSRLCSGWMRDGHMRDIWRAEQLAWEFMSPIGNLRTTFWDKDASAADVRKGIKLARAHAEYFITCNLGANAPQQRQG